jgi:hypothetical protein
MIEIPFGEWLPDQSDFKNPGLEECRNALPSPNGYQPALGFSAEVADAGAAVLSAAMFERTDGTRVTVCATASDLKVIVSGTVTASGLALALTEYVVFVRFGQEIYATCKSGDTWKLDDVDTDTTFAAVAGTVPSGMAMARISDFMFMGNLTDTDASNQPYRIRWSPFNNPSGAWATDVGLQSDAVDMPQEFGPVTAITGWRFGMVFQKYGISRIYYTGGASVFQKEVVDRQRGCASTASVVAVGDRAYFLAEDGFFFTDGGPAQTISRGRVWSWFVKNAGQNYLDRVKGAADWPNRCIFWTIPNASGVVTAILCFNWETDRWSVVDLEVDVVFGSGQDGLTLEQYSTAYPDLDAVGNPTLDSAEFRARGRSVAAFQGGKLYQMTGAALPARFETGEFQLQPGRRVFVRGVTPLVINPTEDTTVSLAVRERQNEDVTYSAETVMGPLGEAPFNTDARYCRVQIKTPAGVSWRDAFGFQMDASVAGRY